MPSDPRLLSKERLDAYRAKWKKAQVSLSDTREYLYSEIGADGDELLDHIAAQDERIAVLESDQPIIHDFWISVADRLPDPGVHVLISGGIAYRDLNWPETWRSALGDQRPIMWKVTHWMPIPVHPTCPLYEEPKP